MSGFDWSGGDGGAWGWFRNHPHRVSIVFIALIGVLAFISLFTERRGFFFFLVFLALFIYMIWNTPDFLVREQVVDRWSMLIAGGNEQADLIIAATVRGIEENEPPDVEVDFVELAARRQQIGGRMLPFLVVRNTSRAGIKPYRMHMNAREYGNNLQVSWYLSFHPSAWQRFRGRLGEDLDLFDEEELRAYVTVVHQSFTEAVLEALNTLGQDTNVNRTSQGFLNVT